MCTSAAAVGYCPPFNCSSRCFIRLSWPLIIIFIFRMSSNSCCTSSGFIPPNSLYNTKKKPLGLLPTHLASIWVKQWIVWRLLNRLQTVTSRACIFNMAPQRKRITKCFTEHGETGINLVEKTPTNSLAIGSLPTSLRDSRERIRYNLGKKLSRED